MNAGQVMEASRLAKQLEIEANISALGARRQFFRASEAKKKEKVSFFEFVCYLLPSFMIFLLLLCRDDVSLKG